MEWLRIGEVARRTGLTHRTLRHYDEIGLLTPSGRTDVDYRLYSRDDLVRLLAVQSLKSLGLSLTEIAEALNRSVDASELLGRHADLLAERIESEERLLATLRHLHRAADSGWDEVLGAIELTQRLRHPDPAVRFRASLDDPSRAPVEVLLDLLADPVDGVREGATWALVQRPGILGELTTRMGHADATTRLALTHALGKLRDPAAVELLTALLADDDPLVAAKAAFSLGQLEGEAAAQALAASLGDRRDPVRSEIIASLGRSDSALPFLLDALRQDAARVREASADALGLLGDPEGIDALVESTSDEDEGVRFASLVALGQFDDIRAGRAIREASASQDGRVGLLANRLVTDLQST